MPRRCHCTVEGAVVDWRSLDVHVVDCWTVALQGGVVDYGLGGERASSGGVEIVVVLVISFWVSGQEMDSWSHRAVPWSWSRKTVAWKTGSELHLIHKATGDCGIQCDAHCVHSPIQRYGIVVDG